MNDESRFRLRPWLLMGAGIVGIALILLLDNAASVDWQTEQEICAQYLNKEC